MACVGNSSPFSDHRTLQPTRELTHTTAAIQGSANSAASASGSIAARNASTSTRLICTTTYYMETNPGAGAFPRRVVASKAWPGRPGNRSRRSSRRPTERWASCGSSTLNRPPHQSCVNLEATDAIVGRGCPQIGVHYSGPSTGVSEPGKSSKPLWRSSSPRRRRCSTPWTRTDGRPHRGRLRRRSAGLP